MPTRSLGTYRVHSWSDTAQSTGVEAGAFPHGVRVQVVAGTNRARREYGPLARLMAILEEHGLNPSRVITSEDGDIDAYFFAEGSSDRFVTIGVDEDFDLGILFSDRPHGIADVEGIEPAQLRSLLPRVRQFLKA